ncbi:hypothetical protein BO85DRAFT_484195 [Aspergillus piperis CBS 112811]|uniref:Uncharacterized protein n=1 Tax=Aspergillus piperis CBS 112811 TaxID=1448313 RepID=A0A8G1VQU4_9EURO|nr:hypothetical protein BO85DRAFT_484195 [Aspergillus piperis CBS 112811]RAH62181.1 hypothetical protein BO85DRAFT_484195 [Aspergillus piperis CBS 112811]
MYVIQSRCLSQDWHIPTSDGPRSSIGALNVVQNELQSITKLRQLKFSVPVAPIHQSGCAEEQMVFDLEFPLSDMLVTFTVQYNKERVVPLLTIETTGSCDTGDYSFSAIHPSHYFGPAIIINPQIKDA